MMSTIDRARYQFKHISGKTPVRPCEVRWYAWYEITAQIYDSSDAVRRFVEHDDDFAEALRESLREMIHPDVVEELRMELAIAKNAGDVLVKLCYHQEGDNDFLCVGSYDHWHEVQSRLKEMSSRDTPIDELRVLSPSVSANADALSDNVAGAEGLILDATDRIRPVYHKMLDDSVGRLEGTFRILRACRMLDWRFVASKGIASLQQEIHHISAIPVLNEALHSLVAELPKYKSLADAEATKAALDRRNDVGFWAAMEIELPEWFDASREVGLVCPSSACMERGFSMLTNLFNDQLEAALKDMVCTRVMIRYNSNSDKKEIDYLRH